jgi:hypothetical protein
MTHVLNDPMSSFLPIIHHPIPPRGQRSSAIQSKNINSSTNIDPPSSQAIQSLINITLWGENDGERDGRRETNVNPMLVDAIEEDPRAIEDPS